MKKSVLWTAAGVVSATALWAAISLPYTRSCSTTPVTVTLAPTEFRQDILTIRHQGGSLSLPLRERFTLYWNGERVLIASGDGHQRFSFPAASTDPTLPLEIEKLHVSSGPGYSSRSTTRYNQTVQRGGTIEL